MLELAPFEKCARITETFRSIQWRKNAVHDLRRYGEKGLKVERAARELFRKLCDPMFPSAAEAAWFFGLVTARLKPALSKQGVTVFSNQR
jgi:hypothetical protein